MTNFTFERAILIFFLYAALTSTVRVSGQEFHFGGEASLLLAQVDGDNLRGFNKFGFGAGLFTGYTIAPNHGLLLELQYAEMGSRQRKEVSGVKLETDIQTLNILFAYTLRFGDTWDGKKKYRLVAGPRLHSIQKAKIGLHGDRSLLDRYFLAAHAGFGILLSESFVIELAYEQGLTNILKETYQTFDKLAPYSLSIGLVYYLYK